MMSNHRGTLRQSPVLGLDLAAAATGSREIAVCARVCAVAETAPASLHGRPEMRFASTSGWGVVPVDQTTFQGGGSRRPPATAPPTPEGKRRRVVSGQGPAVPGGSGVARDGASAAASGAGTAAAAEQPPARGIPEAKRLSRAEFEPEDWRRRSYHAKSVPQPAAPEPPWMSWPSRPATGKQCGSCGDLDPQY